MFAWQQVEVRRRTRLAADVVGLTLLPRAGEHLPRRTAGAHIDVRIADDLIRQYSLCNDEHERDCYRIAVLRDPHSRGGSIALCDGTREGSEITISAPRNNFRLHLARHSLLLGGGIGIAPLLPMAQSLQRSGASFELHYCSHSRARAALLPELAAPELAPHVRLHFSDESGHARGQIGTLLAHLDPFVHVYACGPTGFVEHVKQCAIAADLDERQVHFEPFATPAAMQPSRQGPAFAVRIRSTGKTYTIPADTPVTQALTRHGIRIPVSCEAGNCGTCLTRIVEGIPDHRDTCLSEAERASNRVFAPCCSRARDGVLVLDL